MENFVDPFLLVLTLVLTICLIFGNIYFLAHYSHHSDSFFGSSTACKAVLVSILNKALSYKFALMIISFVLIKY